MKHQLIVSSALAAVLASGLSAPVFADNANKEKCYGIAKAAQNDCANLSGSHSCAGMAKKDKDPNEWILVAKGTCESLGGLSKEQAEAKVKSQK